MFPVKPPQSFQLPGRFIEGIDEDIIQTLEAPNTNHFLFITKTRLFVYQAKPFAPLACHERTNESVELFGYNFGIRDNLPFGSKIKGFFKDQFCDPVIVDRWYFYVMTRNNFLLVYELYTKTSENAVFKEYGIPLNLSSGGNLLQSVVDDDIDDEVLTVFSAKENHKVIQNGYTISKQKGFMQFMRNDDIAEEMPIRRTELRLNVVLKFDHLIIDVIGIIAHDKDQPEQTNQYLLVLFDHGLQILKLEDFKLIENKLIHVIGGMRLKHCAEQILVLTSDGAQQSVQHIIFGEQKIESHSLVSTEFAGAFKDSVVFDHLLIIAYEKYLIYYDVLDKIVISKQPTSFKISCISALSSDAMVLLAENNSIVFMSKWGNILLSMAVNQADFKILHSSIIDTKLLVSGTNGTLQLWNLWKKSESSLSNFRTNKVFTLINDNNDILLYSPMSDSTNTSAFQTIKLPTKTVNNNVTVCKTNGILTLMVVYVANKGILLINFLNSNKWISFDQVDIKGIEWLSDDYLLCHFTDDENEKESVKCYHFPSLRHDSTSLEDFKVWEWEVPNGQRLDNFFANTLSTYKALKFAEDSDEEGDNSSKKLFVTSEILMVLSNSRVVIFDALCSVHPTGVNLVQKFHQYKTFNFPENSLRGLKWIYRYKDGFIAWIKDELVIIGQQEDEQWRFQVAYDRLEQILEKSEDSLVIVSGNEVLLCDFAHVWAVDDPLISTPVIEEEYPISISLDTATFHNISCISTQKLTKLSISHSVYLDKIVDRNLALGVDGNKIDEKYRDLKHYKFSLEKILSNKVLEHENLDSILALIDTYDRNSGDVVTEVGKLEIIGNCLRKIETEHWDYLFENLNLTPRDLITKCISLSEAKILGTMLMVFLNYDDGGIEANAEVPPKTPSQKKKKKKSNKKNKNQNTNTNTKDPSPDTSVFNILKDETVIGQVLKIFVSTAILSTTKEQAQEYWDFALQLIRFLRALDSKGDTTLAQTCLDLI
ncbi:unnamed protein product [Kluyveromyces dobzhanskii CBS 2104]|uniref:WGS project CCBQ000000000 data, contig 00107 n=1 Tax=Kluyveromyces dobzhanskii CBS 2104 TaxID=1427455 RepID=A0A0A8KZ29_9SACH|nr:unnamed protein product [Kluyveromyces dobzhanskii CBS 2104]